MNGTELDSYLNTLRHDQRRVLELTRALENTLAVRDTHAAALSRAGVSTRALAAEMGITFSAAQAMIRRVLKDKVL